MRFPLLIKKYRSVSGVNRISAWPKKSSISALRAGMCGSSGRCSPAGVWRVRRHPRPPQLSTPVRCPVSDATAGRRSGPVSGYLPEAGGDCREVGEPGFSQRGNRQPDEPFERSGAQNRAQDVFTQPPRADVGLNLLALNGLNVTVRLSGEVRKEGRTGAGQRVGLTIYSIVLCFLEHANI